jgi:putative glutathione S-transferase
MGRMVDGQWQSGWAKPGASGAFERGTTKFRDKTLVPELGRYHLYVSYACPWAHRTLIVRALRGLEDALPVTVVEPKMGLDGWVLSDGRFLRDVYVAADAHFTGHVTVPILWDEKRKTIANNESRELIRMFDTDLEPLAKNKSSLAPPELRARIDETLTAIYEPVNNGVYRAGFATSQSAYEAACRGVFEALDHWNDVLGKQRFMCGDVMTEADVAMFTTCLRFDLVYYAHFKCNVRRMQDYPNLWGFVRDMYQRPEIQPTCNLEHIKTHYYWSQENVNPTRIVPIGPTLPLDEPHDRARFGG